MNKIVSIFRTATVLATLLLAPEFSHAQKTGRQYIPGQTSFTPEWFKVFYKDDFERKVNVNELDLLAKQYQKDLRKAKEKAGTKGLPEAMESGEESMDAYLLYYRRWRRSVAMYVQADGSLKIPLNSAPAAAVNQRILNSPGITGVANWSLVGPKVVYWPPADNPNPAEPKANYQVNIYACAMAKTNHNIVFAAPETGGIFKTTDKGLNWSLVGDFPVTTPFTAITVDPLNQDSVYAGRTNEIMITANGGASWSPVSIPGCGDINRIVVHPSDPAVLYAACSNGLYQSANRGASWASVLSGTCYDAAFKTNDKDYLVCLLKTGGNVTRFYYTTNNGGSFTNVTLSPFITSDNGGRLTVTAADNQRMYAVILSSDDDKPYIFRSTNAGASWTNTCTGITQAAGGLSGNTSMPLGMTNGQGFWDLDIIADPANADNVITGVCSAYRSTDGGNTFTRLGGYGGGILGLSLHPDFQCMIADGTDTWIATDGGMSYSSDFFATVANFSSRNNGIFGSEFWGFAQGWHEDIVGGGRYHNGNTALYESWPAGNGLRLGGGEAPTGYYLFGKTRSMAFSDIGGVVLPTDFPGNASAFPFTKFPNEYYISGASSEVEFFPYCYGQIYLGKDNELWRSKDGGLSWTSVYNFGSGTGNTTLGLEISRSNPAVMYMCTANGLYRSADTGYNWTAIPLPAGTGVAAKSISLSATNENELWFTGEANGPGSRVFKTINGGTSWINLTTAAIDGQGYNNIVHQAGTNGGVYILGKGGNVFYRNNTMPDWVDYSTQLPKGNVPFASRPFYRDSKLRTAGNRAIWQTDFYEPGVPVAQPSVDKLTSSCARDTFYFDDYSVLKYDGSQTWNWTFSGNPAYVSSTTIRNPKVVFGAPGVYDFSLTVSNSGGSSTKAIQGKINISQSLCAPDTIPGNVLTTAIPASGGSYAQTTQPLNVTTNNLTISLWIKPNGSQNEFAGIVQANISGGNSGINLSYQGGGTSPRIGYHWANSQWWWQGGPVLTNGKWTHIAAVFEPARTTIYADGIAYTNAVPNPALLFDQAFRIASDPRDGFLPGRVFQGDIDEVAIYNRALSENEVRELMNLTRNNPNTGSLPGNDASLLAYYQFNEGAALPAYDKVRHSHAFLIGSASKSAASTAPVGGGTFERINITAAGLYQFSNPGVSIHFAGGTTPNGDVVASRVNVAPDQLPITNILPSTPQAYYVIRNYGTNSAFSPLTSLAFNRVQGTTSTMETNPGALKLFKRPSNDFGATWGAPVDNADMVTGSAGTGTVTFSTGLGVTSFSQFSIGADIIIPPVNLLSFTAELQPDKTVLLKWVTANEINFDRFEIERSPDAVSYSRIGIVAAAGGGNYSFADASPSAGNNYYRLKLVDRNGNFTYSASRLVRLETMTRLVTVSPNPSENGLIRLKFSDRVSGKISIVLYNEAGQQVRIYYKEITPLETVILNPGLAAGNYMLRFEFANASAETHKIVL